MEFYIEKSEKKKKEGDDFGEGIFEYSPVFNNLYLDETEDFFEKENPEFHQLMKRVQKDAADKETT